MRIGTIVCAKSIEHRSVVEMKEDKNGRQKPLTNRFGYKFQSEHNLLSQVGVFIFLGSFPEQTDPAITQKFAEDQLRRLGWCDESPVSSVVGA